MKTGLKRHQKPEFRASSSGLRNIEFRQQFLQGQALTSVEYFRGLLKQ
jgi:hypothetical protein